MSNSKPISLLTTFSKESEKMHSRLSYYLLTNNILAPEEFGLRKFSLQINSILKIY
jgi:hypothetical protein